MFYLLIGIVIAVSFNDTFRERLAQNCRTGRTIFITDAHRGDGKRYVVRAGEKLSIAKALPKERQPRHGAIALRLPTRYSA